MARPKRQRSIYAGLAPFERELPPLADFALLAAILGPRENPQPGQYANEAFDRAVKFYQRAADFHEAYRNATPEERARLCGEGRIAEVAKFAQHAQPDPTPERIPATYDEFLRLVVKGKDETESTKRLRDFFEEERPPLYPGESSHPFYEGRQEEPATKDTIPEPGDYIGLLKGKGFRTMAEWRYYAWRYVFWWQQCVANQNKENRTGKTKKPPAEA